MTSHLMDINYCSQHPCGSEDRRILMSGLTCCGWRQVSTYIWLGLWLVYQPEGPWWKVWDLSNFYRDSSLWLSSVLTFPQWASVFVSSIPHLHISYRFKLGSPRCRVCFLCSTFLDWTGTSISRECGFIPSPHLGNPCIVDLQCFCFRDRLKKHMSN